MSPGEQLQFKRIIVLTGAGFTKNFGGFLNNEIQAKIFNYPPVQKQNRIRDLLIRLDNFEAVHAEIFKEPAPNDQAPYTDEEKLVFNEAVERAYHHLDKEVGPWGLAHSSMSGPGFLERLISRANSGQQGVAAFFTLNQDILMERYCGKRSFGAHPFKNERLYNSTNWPFSPDQFVVMPTQEEVETTKTRLRNENNFFAKLHGSYGWLTRNGDQQRMVIGAEKSDQIKNEPLLNWYMDLFREAVHSGNKRILVVGYSFGDRHINQVLEDGCREKGLEVFILNPKNPGEFWKGQPSDGMDNIRHRTLGYFPYTFAQIFPEQSEDTTYFEEINEALAA